MTRAEAKAQGLRYYDPGRPCLYGHVTLWLTARGRCQECNRLENAKNKAIRLEYQKTDAGRQVHAKAKQRYRQSVKGKVKERAYKDEYRPRENELARKRAKLSHNLAKQAFRQQVRRDALARMHPSHLIEIVAIYEDARLLGLTIDHIIPLYSETVWGLHAPQNLQMLTRVENARKSNLVAA